MKSPRHRISLTVLPTACALIVMFAQSASLGAPIVFMDADTSSSRLFRFDNGVQTFGVPAPSGALFHGLTILNGNVLVADYGGDAIRRYTPNGVPAGIFALTTSPTFLESDSGGNIYTNPGPLGLPVATRFNSAGVVTQVFSDPGLHQLAGMDADAAGNVYVADIFGSTRSLFKFTPTGVFLTSLTRRSCRATWQSMKRRTGCTWRTVPHPGRRQRYEYSISLELFRLPQVPCRRRRAPQSKAFTLQPSPAIFWSPTLACQATRRAGSSCRRPAHCCKRTFRHRRASDSISRRLSFRNRHLRCWLGSEFARFASGAARCGDSIYLS
jgi:hypothetical protein